MANKFAQLFLLKDFHSRFSANLAGKSRWVKLNAARTLSVEFHPSFDGEYKNALELVFLDTSTRSRFLITRQLCAVVGSKDDHQQLKPKSAYSRRKPAPFQFDGPIIRSLRPPTWGPIKWTSRLPEFKAPQDLIQAAFGPSSGSNTRTILQAVRQFLPAAFTVKTYGHHFQTMLYLEDEQMRFVFKRENQTLIDPFCRQDLEMYAMTDVELKPNYPRYE